MAETPTPAPPPPETPPAVSGSLTYVGGALDRMASARTEGHGWPDIHGFLANGTRDALGEGYSQRQIDAYLGWSDPAPVQDTAAAAWRTAEPPPEEIRGHYAEALGAQQVKGPGDFAEHYTAGMALARGDVDPEAKADLVSGLPTADEVTDWSIRLAAQAGDGRPEAIAGLRNQLLDEWHRTGASLADIASKGWAALPDVGGLENVGEALTAGLGEIGQFIGDELRSAAQAWHDTPSFVQAVSQYLDRREALAKEYAGLPPEEQAAMRQRMPLVDLRNPFVWVMGTTEGGGKIIPFSDQEVLKAGGIPPQDFPFMDVSKIGRDLLSRAERLPNAPYLVFDPREESGYVGVFPTKKAAEDYISDKPQLDYGTPREIEYWNPTGEEDPEYATQRFLRAIRSLVANTEGSVKLTSAKVRALRVAAMAPPPLETGGSIQRAIESLDGATRADKLNLVGLVRDLPPEFLTPELSRNAYHDVEARLANPEHTFSPETENFLAHPSVRWMAEEQTRRGKSVLAKLKNFGMAEEMDLPTTWRGYVHRVRLGEEAPPEPGPGNPVIGRRTPISGRSLTRFAPGAEARKFYVLEDDEGTRLFAPNTLDDVQNYRYGSTIEQAGKTWKIVQPTTREIEANVPGLQFRDNWLANTLDNLLELGRVDRNLDLLDRLKVDLTASNQLFEQWRRTGPRTKVQVGGKPPEDWVKLQPGPLDGYWAPPKIAEPVNDFFGSREPGMLGRTLGKINRFLVGALFATPFPHGLNIATQFAINRGFEWANPQGYARLARSANRALRAVADPFSDDFTNSLRQGTALFSGDAAAQRVYRVLVDRILGEQTREPDAWHDFAQSLGFVGPAVDAVGQLAKAEYAWSNHELWRMGDFLMLMRKFELEERGYSSQDAIRIAERDIPSYRIGPRILGSRVAQEYLNNPNISLFGRYHFSLLKSAGTMIGDAIRPMEEGDRLRAAGRLAMLAAFGYLIYPLVLDPAAKWVTGNPEAEATRHGLPALVQAAYGLSKGQNDWANLTTRIFALPPVWNIGRDLVYDKDFFGRPILSPFAAPADQNISQALDEAGHEFFPLGLALDIAKGNGLNAGLKMTGLASVPSPGAVWFRQHPLEKAIRDEKARANRDSLLQFIRRVPRLAYPKTEPAQPYLPAR